MSTYNSSYNSDIPVLTDTIEKMPKYSVSTEQEPPVLQDILNLPPILDTAKNEDAWNDLEYRLTARILRQVQERMQLMLENSIQQGVSMVLSEVTQKLITEIKNDLESTLEVVIAHSVSEEMLRLHKQALNLHENTSSKIEEK